MQRHRSFSQREHCHHLSADIAPLFAATMIPNGEFKATRPGNKAA